MNFKFEHSEKNPFGFKIKPPVKEYQTLREEELYPDTDYIEFIFTNGSDVVKYLFDKDKNHISWQQRQKEVESVEVKKFKKGFKVERRRTIHFTHHESGYETITDTIFKNAVQKQVSEPILGSELEFDYDDFNLIESVFGQMHKADLEEQEKHQEFLLSSYEQQKKLMSEEVESDVVMRCYHSTFRGYDFLEDEEYASFDNFSSRYFSEVDTPEEMYIYFLCCIVEGLESAATGMEYDEEDFVKEYSERYGKAEAFKKYYEPRKVRYPKLYLENVELLEILKANEWEIVCIGRVEVGEFAWTSEYEAKQSDFIIQFHMFDNNGKKSYIIDYISFSVDYFCEQHKIEYSKTMPEDW